MHRTTLATLAALAALPAAAQPVAQNPPLVALGDLNTAKYSTGGPYGYVASGDRAYFVVNDGVFGAELWTTLGTPVSTSLTREILPGAGPSYPENLFPLGDGRVLFSATTPETGIELWVSDGSAAGTNLVADLNPGNPNGLPDAFVRLDDATVLFAATGPHGRELWSLDLPTMTASEVVDINPGGDALPRGGRPVVYAGRAYFAASRPADGFELWSTDGTAAGTSLLADLAPGPAGSGPRDLVVAGGRLYFAACTPTEGCEMYSFDGSALTPLVLAPGPASSVGMVTPTSAPPPAAALGGFLYFIASTDTQDRAIWRTDGTPAGTVPVLTASNPPVALGLLALDDRLLFVGQTRVSYGLLGPTLWSWTPGQTRPTRLLTDSSSPTKFTRVGGRVYFSNNYGGPARLWVSDGTAAGTGTAQSPTAYHAEPSAGVDFGGRLLATLYDPAVGREPFILGPDGPTLVRDIRLGESSTGSSADVRGAVAVGERVLFTATTLAQGTELWTTDGTPGGTSLVVDQVPGYVSGALRSMAPFGGAVYLGLGEMFIGMRLWRTDGTPAGTVKIDDLAVAAFGFQGPIISLGDRLVFGIQQLSRPDSPVLASSTGGRNAAQAVPGLNNGQVVTGFVKCAGRAFFTHTPPSYGFPTPPYSVYSTDGLAVTEHDIPGVQTAQPTLLTAAGDTLYFVARGDAPGPTGLELWRWTPADGVGLVADLRPGPDGSSPADLVGLPDRLVFTADDGQNGREVYILPNGAAAPTRVDLLAGPASFNPRGLVRVGNAVYVVTDSLGAPVLRLDPYTGSATAVPGLRRVALDSIVDVDGIAYMYAVVDGPFAYYRTDGTAVGTLRVPGDPTASFVGGSSVSATAYTPRRAICLITLSTPAAGQEPYALTFCRADFDHSGQIDAMDVTAFLADWFDARPRADYTRDGPIDVLDIFAFLDAWFAGPC